MKIGAWIHDYDGMSLDEQIPLAAANGLRTLRSHHILYGEKLAPALCQAGMSLFAGYCQVVGQPYGGGLSSR